MSDPWVKFYPSDWLAGTSGLTAAERGVYVTIVMLIYENEGPITVDEGRLARRCGTTKAAFKKLFQGLCDEEKLTFEGGKISNKRAEKELCNRAIRSQKAKSSADQRWNGQRGKSEQNQDPDNANALKKSCARDANQKPEAREVDTNVSPSKGVRQKPPRFQEFWDQYPHRGGAKKGRGKAEEKYARIVRSGISEQSIIAGAVRYAMDRQVVQGYARDPTTWLNNRGWEDEIEPAKPTVISGGQDVRTSSHTDPTFDLIAHAARSR